MLENDDDEIEYEGQESTDTEYLIDNIEATQESIDYGLYSQLSAFANFYSRIQNNYKRMTITWLIASFVALGYIFSKESPHMPVNPAFIAIFICGSVMCGITLLWFLDIVIYQTYFYGVILEQMKIEKKYKWIPNVSINILYNQTNKKTIVSQSFFYINCQIMLLFILFGITISLFDFKLYYVIGSVIFYVFLGMLVRYTMLRIEHPKSNPLTKQFHHLKSSKKKK